MATLEQLLNMEDGFDHLKGAVGQAMQAHLEQKKERFAESLVATCEALSTILDNQVRDLRAARKVMRAKEAQVKALDRARQYFEETANALPFFDAQGQRYSGEQFCTAAGVDVPDADSPLWKIPEGWKPSTNVSEEEDS